MDLFFHDMREGGRFSACCFPFCVVLCCVALPPVLRVMVMFFRSGYLLLVVSWLS